MSSVQDDNELPGKDDLSVPQDSSKDEKIARERQKLLNSLVACRLEDLQSRVAWLLNNYPDARNSDVTLQLKYWEYFERDKYNPLHFSLEDLYRLTKLTSIARARAKIQNTFKLFLAAEEVRKHRGTLEQEEKQKAIADTPFSHQLLVYADESGKNADNLIVGSAWLADGYESWQLTNHILKWKLDNKFNGELHFVDVSDSKLKKYIDLIDLVLNNYTTLGFKAISVNRKGITDRQNAFMKLFYHMLAKGIEHENTTGRAPLPRGLSFYKDSEEAGYDQLLIAEISDKMKQAAYTIFDNKLHIDVFEAVDSKESPILQLADLFVSSVNRVLNHDGDGGHAKDKLAKYFLSALGINERLPGEDRLDDMTVHFKL